MLKKKNIYPVYVSKHNSNREKQVILLKAHRHISKKWCLGKYFSCHQAYQFLALLVTPWRSYLENLIIDKRFKQTSSTLYTSNDVSGRKKFCCIITMLRNSCLIVLFKKIQKQPPEVQKQLPDVLCKKRCS